MRAPGLSAATAVALILAATNAHATCIGPYAETFSSGSLAPLWADVSDVGSSVAESGGKLVMTKGTGGTAAVARMVPATGELCGDFDIQVDYSLDNYVAGTVGADRYHGVSIVREGSGFYVIGIQHYERADNPCAAGVAFYRAWNTMQDCPPYTYFYPTGDNHGAFRIARTGTIIRAYYLESGSWALAISASCPTTPLIIQFESGGSATNPHVASFDNLFIESSLLAPALSPPLLGGVGFLCGFAGVLAIRRRRLSRLSA